MKVQKLGSNLSKGLIIAAIATFLTFSVQAKPVNKVIQLQSDTTKMPDNKMDKMSWGEKSHSKMNTKKKDRMSGDKMEKKPDDKMSKNSSRNK